MIPAACSLTWVVEIALAAALVGWWRTWRELERVRGCLERYAYRMRRELPTDASLLRHDEAPR